MVGLGPGDVPASAPVKFIGAGTAACIADLITFPLDTAKVRLQVNNTSVTNCGHIYTMDLFGKQKNTNCLVFRNSENNLPH